MYAQIAQHRPSTAGPDRTSFITKSSSCRGKLTGLLRAELPLFTDNSNAQKLLYSKFVVKGLKSSQKPLLRHSLTKRLTENNNWNEAIVSSKTLRVQSQLRNTFQVDMTPNRQSLGNEMITNRGRYLQEHVQAKQLHLQTQREKFIETVEKQQLTLRRKTSASGKMTRPRTALSSKNNLNCQMSDYFDQLSQKEVSKNLLRISQSQSLLSRKIDFVKKNIRQNGKKTSFYLTGAYCGSNSKKIEKDEVKQSTLQTKSIDKVLMEVNIKQVTGPNLNELLPNAIQAYQINDENYVLLSKDLSSEQRKQSKLVYESPQIQDSKYYQDFIRTCSNLEATLNRYRRQPPVQQKSNSILSSAQCQYIHENYLKKKCQCSPSQIASINHNIASLVTDLNFFKDRPKQFINLIFQTDYQINVVDQGTEIIAEGSTITQVSIILNGSVTKTILNEAEIDYPSKNFKQAIEQSKVQCFTIFNGEIFGMPNSNKQAILNHTVRALQPCLLMQIPWQQYNRVFNEFSSITHRVDILQTVFGSTRQKNGTLKAEDLQLIAYQIQSQDYEGKQLIVREGQTFDSLILIAEGIVSVVKEHIVSIDKKVSKDMHNRPKSSSRIAKPLITSMRRTNLINYQLLTNTATQLDYYSQQIQHQLTRGEALNWQSLVNNNPNSFSSQRVMPYSLICTADYTKIYTISLKKIMNLPDAIRDALLAKARHNVAHPVIHCRDTQSVEKWSIFKQQICDRILALKHQRK